MTERITALGVAMILCCPFVAWLSGYSLDRLETSGDTADAFFWFALGCMLMLTSMGLPMGGAAMLYAHHVEGWPKESCNDD